MANDATARAAQALLAYRRGDGPADLRARDLCRRLAEAIQGSGTVGPQNTSSPAFLTLGLELLANRDPGVRELVDALAAAVGPPAPPEPRSPTQNVHVTGNGHTVNVAGRDLHTTGPAAARHRPEPEPSREPRITVLFAAASPIGMAPLRVGEEMRKVSEALELSHGRDRFDLQTRHAQRPRDFTRALLQLRPRVVHFSGHGAGETGELCFEGDDGYALPADAQGLRGIFAGLGGAVECVVLNACYSHTNAAAISESVPYVIGMTAAVTDDVAIAFAEGFYQALGAGMEIPAAHEWGCAYMRMNGMGDPPPVLVRRGG
jgi:hypothetical protein